MKKKLIIIGVMIFVCSGLFVLVQKVQNSYLNNKVITTTPVQNKGAEVASNSAVQAPAKAGSVSEKSKTNTVTDAEKQSSTANKSSAKAKETPKAIVAAPKSETPQSKDKGPFNFTILDAVNNKVIVEKNIDLDNVTVDYITCKLLSEAGIKYINEGEGSSSSYFNSIAGRAERKNGPTSGWCFYVNGKKPGIGAGSYIYHKGDKVQWKYSTDALSN